MTAIDNEYNLQKTIDADDLCEFDIYELINAIRCEGYLINNCEDPADKRCALKRINVIKKEFIRRFNFMVRNGIRYAVVKEEKEEFDNGVITHCELFEVSNYVSHRNFTFRNVGRPIAYYAGNVDNVDFNNIGVKPFDIVIKEVSGGIIISIEGVVIINHLDENKVRRSLWYLRN